MGLVKLLSNLKAYAIWFVAALLGFVYALFRIEQGKVASEKLRAKTDALKASEEIRSQNSRVAQAIDESEQKGSEAIEKANSDSARRDFD